MANQEYAPLTRAFTLDLHRVQTKEAARVTRARISECFRYGIRSLKCVFGSPDSFHGSIAEKILDIAFTDERVVSNTLSEWVFSDDIDVSRMPIFLVLPLRLNPDATPVTADSAFSGFAASFESAASLRLLCKMPFQPLREYYDWQYAARAIGNGCKERLLREYSAAAGLNSRDQGLSLSDLMQCADGYGRWCAGQTKAEAMFTAPAAPPVRAQLKAPVFYTHSQPRTIEALFLQADRHLSNDELEACHETVSITFSLIENDAHKMQHELLLGRALSRENAAECEGHLLQADKLCVGVHGESSSRRIPILRELASWYGRTGDVSQLLALNEIGAVLEVSDSTPLPVKKRFVSDFGYARLLRQGGLYQESVYVLRLFIWQVLMGQTREMPKAFETPLDALLKGKISRVQVASLHLLYTMNCTDDENGDFSLATHMLDLCHFVLGDVAGQELLRAEIEQERGRIARKRGEFDRAIRHYEVAGRLIKDAREEDPYRLYKLHLNIGVVKAQIGDLKSASADYEKAWALAEKLNLTEQIFVYELLQSRASLALRKRDFTACERLASEAADLITLKASQRHKDIGLARFRQGVALCHLEYFDKAFYALSEAQREFEAAGTFGEHRPQLEMYLKVASNKLSEAKPI
ncbi:hypothetical protein [Tunturiibacter gelidoferens]|uniref:Tetratricopeptide (TPR) repeat protein n=1 Tax=Tunturiibacter gelidiferens TaxID=3069689 RepID=A0A9X0QFS6_9BACT|nr:hypothetical protein [Edaphobacter lichenicola]MBB5329430.1 tetratricopeptide (TPR) repeat protein [Edaphobacter lichenicola]